MPNLLTKGTRRTGDFFDSYDDTPEVKVTLERTESRIGVTVAWSSPDVPYAAWFLNQSRLFIGRNEELEPKPAPKRIVFRDSHGDVLLIRCWPRGYHASGLGPGSGTLWSRAAIMGVSTDLEFDRPHGLQTDVSGLREWLGVTSWDEQGIGPHDERPFGVTSRETKTLNAGSHGEITLDFRTGWSVRHEEQGDRRILLDILRCTTRSEQPTIWDEHLRLHHAIRDLLVISRWRNESCVEVRALREDDPLTTLDGKQHGEQWREVVVPIDEKTPAPTGYYPHLVQYQDLGEAGITQWVTLRDTFSRALDPIISSVELGKITPQTRLAHTGPGLEALGYLLLLRDGRSAREAADARLQARLDRILEDVGTCLPFDGAEWASQTIATYNGLKHANRAQPEQVDVMNSWAKTVVVVRAWVAKELGIPLDVLKTRLTDDRQPWNYESIL